MNKDYPEPKIESIFDIHKKFHDGKKLKELKRMVSKLSHIPFVIKKIFEEEKETKYIDYDVFKKSGMRVLFMSIPFSIKSGVTTVAKNLTNIFNYSGANIAIINHWWHRYYFWNKNKITQKYDKKIHVRMSPYSLLTGKGEFVELKWAAKLLFNDLKNKFNYNPEIIHIHTHTFYEDGSFRQIKKYFPKIPIVYTLHAFIPFIRMNRENRIRLLNDEMSDKEIQKHLRDNYHGREKSQHKMILNSDRIITISDIHKEAFDRFYPKLKDKCVSIPNGTNFDMYSEMNSVIKRSKEIRKNIAPNGEKIVIYVGRIEAQKGTKKLVDSFNLICKKFPSTKLVLIGSDESKLNDLKFCGLKKYFENNLVFPGWIKDKELLASYYRIADVMIQPVASKDLYSLVALEAMIMEVPVISCPGSLSFDHCKTANNIFKAVKRIFNDKSSAERHAKIIKQKVMDNYSLRAQYEKHLELYKSLL